ncbi:MAG: glycerophosphodiester phosphodiesterase [Actinomycetia bacterium]|nr:glycerophosphodiester phosphodiesterase [Actinomycetes bacterium]
MFRRLVTCAVLAVTFVVAGSADHVALVPAPGPTVSRQAVPVPVPSRATLTQTGELRISDIAHRGASAYAPENTLAAFREAARRHADLFELDVRQTRDGKLIIMHDATLARTTNVERVFPKRGPWRVEDFTLAEVRRLDAGSWKGKRFKGERVPTLGETLRAMNGRGLGLLLEIKAPARQPGIGERVAAKLRAHRAWLRPGRLIMHCFNWDFAEHFHRLLPQVPIGLLGTAEPGRFAALATYAGFLDTPYQKVTTSYVSWAHRRHMKVFAWTVDDRRIMRRMIATGVDGIITDRPDTLRRAL